LDVGLECWAGKPDPKYISISAYFAKVGAKGGKARLVKMTAEQRNAIATKASKAAAKARTAAAKARRAKKNA
jgi:hypothetical protein